VIFQVWIEARAGQKKPNQASMENKFMKLFSGFAWEKEVLLSEVLESFFVQRAGLISGYRSMMLWRL
jgi:hypothetical protein